MYTHYAKEKPEFRKLHLLPGYSDSEDIALNI